MPQANKFSRTFLVRNSKEDDCPVWVPNFKVDGLRFYWKKDHRLDPGQQVTNDPDVLLALLLLSYTVRCLDVTGKKGIANALSSSKMEAVIFEGVNLKEAFPNGYFVKPEEPWDMEKLKQYGLEHRAAVEAFKAEHPDRLWKTAAETYDLIVTGRI